jgi:hypothetical protein
VRSHRGVSSLVLYAELGAGQQVGAKLMAGLLRNLFKLDGPMLFGGKIAGLDQGHCLQVVLSADFWFSSLLECNEELGHCAHECVWEPDFFPAG